MNACLCVRAYDTCTQSVLCFARYAQAHVTGSGFVADACACWCVIVAKVLCVKPALFIEITAPCAAYCVCEGCEAGFFFFFFTYTRTTVGFFIRCHVLLIGQAEVFEFRGEYST